MSANDEETNEEDSSLQIIPSPIRRTATRPAAAQPTQQWPFSFEDNSLETSPLPLTSYHNEAVVSPTSAQRRAYFYPPDHYGNNQSTAPPLYPQHQSQPPPQHGTAIRDEQLSNDSIARFDGTSSMSHNSSCAPNNPIRTNISDSQTYSEYESIPPQPLDDNMPAAEYNTSTTRGSSMRQQGYDDADRIFDHRSWAQTTSSMPDNTLSLPLHQAPLMDTQGPLPHHLHRSAPPQYGREIQGYNRSMARMQEGGKSRKRSFSDQDYRNYQGQQQNSDDRHRYYQNTGWADFPPHDQPNRYRLPSPERARGHQHHPSGNPTYSSSYPTAAQFNEPSQLFLPQSAPPNHRFDHRRSSHPSAPEAYEYPNAPGGSAPYEASRNFYLWQTASGQRRDLPHQLSQNERSVGFNSGLYNDIIQQDHKLSHSKEHAKDNSNLSAFSRSKKPTSQEHPPCRERVTRDGYFSQVESSDHISPIAKSSNVTNLKHEEALPLQEIGSSSSTEPAWDTSKLVQPEDMAFSTNFSFATLNESTRCELGPADVKGKRRGLPVGFPGITCQHCKGSKFFPSSIKTMSDTSKLLIPLYNHFIKCKKCPQHVKDELQRLKMEHERERKLQSFGSQKAFFLLIWNRLHGELPDNSTGRGSSFRLFLGNEKDSSKNNENSDGSMSD
uniref:Uncharacterized protein n=1 Tax=Chaetoceros debilis TaxID=122233 RepID=A0A7S3V679_9STRA|eukprot:CAMPEP_0194091442 /NCGR_PEP_ID=MMETSP0149-20130528/43101_1 /TAXON_ID=122233 /ORGANISM="Chaetoceros debilis, Strain MM31A-1" /LENGTH=665 /DNA_ID=CAMNT_0038776033 /DNA_START=23 /DNA_END=2020 /DNA_ORIENTATION=-